MKKSLATIALILCGAAAAQLGGTLEQASAQSGTPVVVQVDPDGVQRATIVLDSYSYSPNHLVVQSGKPVELMLNSVTTLTPHNFVLKEPAAGLDVEKDVGAGKSLTVRFTPTQPGTFSFYCDKKLLFFKSHREKGMEGHLDVR
ncbi:MAG: cupredoxin domain-containing protein [Nitrospiraceae bacterium]